MVEYSEHATPVEGVFVFTLAGNFHGEIISELEYYGLVHGREVEGENGHSEAYYTLKNILAEGLEPWMRGNKISDIIGSLDQWFIVVKTYDVYKREEFAFLLLDLFSESDKARVKILGANFSDETEEVKLLGSKIKNLTQETNPIQNPRAMLVFETHPRNKRRVIAYSSPPPSFSKLP